MSSSSEALGCPVVIIPAYEPPRTLADYVRELLDHGAYEVCVADDGSGAAFDGVFLACEAIPGCRVLRQAENRGKGHALKTAFAYCLWHYTEDTVFVTADADGQHAPSDVLRVAAESLKNPDALVIGKRDFSLDTVPFRSKWGNAWTRLFFRWLHGGAVYDTQSGLRGFRGRLLPRLMAVRGERFEYEMNMLVYALRSSVPILETEIETLYGKPEHRSHFRSIYDSFLVMATLFGAVGLYFLSSFLSAALDVAAFALLFHFLPIPSSEGRSALAKVTARVVSSVLNFYCNFRYVFRGGNAASVLRYYVLWFFQLCASTALTVLLVGVWQLNSVASAVVIDLTLALFSYQIQRRWVFRGKKQSLEA